MPTQFKPAVLVGLLAVLIVACGGGLSRNDKLRDSVYYFNEGVRWGRIQDVLPRLDPEAETHFLEMHKDFGTKIQLSSCEVGNVKINFEEGVAEVTVKFTWYRVDEMVVRQTILVQNWTETEGKWFMAGEEYHSGTPF